MTVDHGVTTAPLTLDTDQCPPVDPGNVDCTEALAQPVGAPACTP